jgi:transcriptional regulator with XRE-family HTH domain
MRINRLKWEVDITKMGTPSRTLNLIRQEITRPGKTPKNINPVARRLALTREILGLTEKEFAERAGVLLGRYHQWESGSIPISLSSAMALCAAHGVTLDWLYRGKILGLPLWLAVEIEVCSAMLGWDDEFRNKGDPVEDGRDRLSRILKRQPDAAAMARQPRRSQRRTGLGGNVRDSTP